MAGGRPTLYKPEYCETVIELGKKGFSPAQVASHLEVTRQSLIEWAKVHPEFSTAFNLYKEHCQSWWENAGMEGMFLGGAGFNAAVWKASVQARFREDYTERQEIHQTGTMEHKINIGDMTDEELASIALGKK